MREQRADTAQALWQALLLHGVLFGLMFLGLAWTRRAAPDPAGGEPVEAQLVDAGDLSAAMQRALAASDSPAPVAPPEPLPQPVEDLPAPVPDEAPPVPEPEPEPPPPMPVPEPSPVPVAPKPLPKPEPAPKPEPPPQPPKPEPPKPEPPKAVPKPEPKPAPTTPMQQAREQQLADLRKQREQAAREAKLAEQKLQQLADARAAQASRAAQAGAATAASAPAGNQGTLRARYQIALITLIERNWIRPDSVKPGQRCQVLIRQLPGGEVAEVQISPSCPYDEAGRRSLEAAIYKSSPLPYAGFESVFDPRIVPTFEARD